MLQPDADRGHAERAVEPVTGQRNLDEMRRLLQQRQALPRETEARESREPVELPPATAPELQEQFIRLTQEKRELKDYAERVTRELRRYQQNSKRPLPEAGPEDDIPLPPWVTNMQMMSPLLFAYEERISELEAVIERSVSIAEQAQLLAQENDQLRAELHERTEQLRNLQLLGYSGGGAPGEAGLVDDQHEELQELYRLSVEQNEALAQQNQLLKLQLERMQQTLAAGRQQAQEVYVKASENTNALAEEVQRGEALAHQRAVAEQRLEEVTAELVDQVSRRDALEAEMESLRHELEVQTQTNEINQKSFQERCALALDEEERLKADLARTQKREGEYRRQALEARNGLDERAEELHLTRKELEATKQEAQQLLQTADTMDRQLVDIRQAHEDKVAQLKDREARLMELQIEKDRLKSTEEASRKQAERLEARLREEISAIKREKEQELQTLKSSQQKMLEDLRKKLRNSEQTSSEATAKAEKLEKQQEWQASALERQSAAYKDEHERLQSDYQNSQEGRRKLEQQLAEVTQQLAKLRSSHDASAKDAKESLARAAADQASLQSQLQAVEQRLSQVQSELQLTSSRALAAEEGLSKAQLELQEARLKANNEVEQAKRQAEADFRRLTRQMKALQSRAQDEEQRASQLLRAQEALRLQWQSELGMEREELESQVERLRRENAAIRGRVKHGFQTLVSGPELVTRVPLS
ncbi:Lama1 [Symbiodinium sp. CCMP2592]|nr:Lama1 [Symbiodinium sp. CCMP2592]